MALSEVDRLSEAEFLAALRLPSTDPFASPLQAPVVVDISTSAGRPDDVAALQERAQTVAGVIVGVGKRDSPLAGLVDVVVEPEDPSIQLIIETVRQNPHASAALAILLRRSEARTVGEGLAAESAVYSMLLTGPEFEAWRSANPIRVRPPDDTSTVRVARDDDRLMITLSRPHVHNAFNARMRDELLEALSIAASDDSIREVVLAGEAPSFCSGGDLDEFGTFPDATTAHLIRLSRSVGWAIAAISDRVVAHLHGACMGSGIELPAFAGRVVAAPNTELGLPEVGMGLIPGAGGTVSLPRRMGRHRTAWLALSRSTIDASTALDWGLVDALEP